MRSRVREARISARGHDGTDEILTKDLPAVRAANSHSREVSYVQVSDLLALASRASAATLSHWQAMRVSIHSAVLRQQAGQAS